MCNVFSFFFFFFFFVLFFFFPLFFFFSGMDGLAGRLRSSSSIRRKAMRISPRMDVCANSFAGIRKRPACELEVPTPPMRAAADGAEIADEKSSYNWMKDFLDVAATPQELASRLALSGRI